MLARSRDPTGWRYRNRGLKKSRTFHFPWNDRVDDAWYVHLRIQAA